MKVENAGAHFDHMLRQTRAHHVILSQTADQKANMLTTVSALAITILIGFADDDSMFRIPVLMMILTCVITCCFAVLTSMPSLNRPKRGTHKSNPLFNPLFFGDFVGLTFEEYEHEMERVLHDHESAYQVQIREIYAIGQYLANRKFRMLRRAYLSLFFGLIASMTVGLVIQIEHWGLIDLF